MSANAVSFSGESVQRGFPSSLVKAPSAFLTAARSPSKIGGGGALGVGNFSTTSSSPPLAPSAETVWRARKRAKKAAKSAKKEAFLLKIRLIAIAFYAFRYQEDT